MLADLGVVKGDRVIIYMPMIPEAVISMLAVARLGAIHSVVFGGFAPPELALRIDDAKPKVILTASCGIEVKRIIEYKPLIDKAFELAKHKPRSCVIFQRPQAPAALTPGRDHEWTSLLAKAKPVGCTPVKGSDPLYILYTSGTTGKPKGVVRENGGHAVALKYSMKAIYDMKPGDVFWASSDVGWVVGHSYIVYGPLLHGCTTVVYEGKPIMTPDAGALWRVCSEYGVKALFTAPTAFRAVKKEDPQGPADEAVRLEQTADHLLRRRTPRPADRSLAHRSQRQAGGGSLVADRDRLVDHRQPARCRTDAGQVRFIHHARPRLQRADPGRERSGSSSAARRATSRSSCRCRPPA